MFGALATACIATLAGIVTYFLMKASHLSVSDSIFVKMDPHEVFIYLKNPNNLPEYNYKYHAVSVEEVKQGDENQEFWQYTVVEDVPHIGHTSFSARSLADPKLNKIVIQNGRLYGLVQHQVIYTLVPGKDEDRNPGTVLTEHNDFNIPAGLMSFINKTTYTTQPEILSNLKNILETGHAGESWQDKYYDDELEDDFDDE